MNLRSDDYELVREFLSGNQQAFNTIARKYQEKIYWHARRMLGDHDDAHEIVQQVLLVMYNKLSSFNFSFVTTLFTSLYAIVVSTKTVFVNPIVVMFIDVTLISHFFNNLLTARGTFLSAQADTNTQKTDKKTIVFFIYYLTF